jgi:hypothetical protein
MELLVTVASLLVALYAIIPRERQMELRFRIGLMEWFSGAAGFILILYLEYYGFWMARGWAPGPAKWPCGLTPTSVKPLIVLSIAMFLGFRIRFARLSRRRIVKFSELCHELNWEEAYPELLSLFERNRTEFFRIYRADFKLVVLRRRLASRVLPTFEDTILRLDALRATGAQRPRDFVDRIPDGIARQLIRFLPRFAIEQRTATELVERVLMAPRFIEALANARPYLGVDIIRELPREFDQQEFLSNYVTALMANPASVFYLEIEKSQNLAYAFPESNHFLHNLVRDAKVARDLEIWRPVGEFALRELDRLAAVPGADRYNQATREFEEREAWRSPICAAIRLFDIMVQAALLQGIEWHMFLYYFPPIVERMVRNYAPFGPLVDLDLTDPTPYNCLIYSAVAAIREWVTTAERVPADQPNVVLRSTRADHENGNIPKSSIIALGECSRHVLLSERLSGKFKDSVMDGTFKLYFTLRLSTKLNQYAVVLGTSLLHGGLDSRTPNPMYLTNLHASFGRLRHEYEITHQSQHVMDLARAIRA